jgi:hypothetical protein
MRAADVTLAIAAYLAEVVEVVELSEGRIFRPELPEREDEHMPQACVLIRPAGGGQLFGRTRLPFKDSRLDIVCYGSTRLEAENLARQVSDALTELESSTHEGVIVRWARISTEPASAIDPNTNWPFALVTTQVMHSRQVPA